MFSHSHQPFFPAFSLPLASAARRPTSTPHSRRRPRPTPHVTPDTPPASPPTTAVPTRLQLARLRLHLLRATRTVSAATPSDPPPTTPSPTHITPPRRHYTAEERRARSDRLREKWADPEWRAAMLARRRSAATMSRMREAARRLWRDPEHRARMRAARLGRPAPNKGVPASDLTRLRMSATRKGVPFSEERRRKMSAAKLNRPDGDDWPRLISEGKKGKTKEYFQIRREFRALYRDLKLWSDSYRARYGRLPSASSYERFVAPMMVFRVRRYLTLRDAIGNDEPDVRKEIISRQ